MTVGLILFWPCYMNSFNNFCIRSIWAFVMYTTLRMWVKTKKTKILEKRIPASRDKFFPVHHDIINFTLCSGCSKFSLLKSPSPKKAPRYFTRAQQTTTPSWITLPMTCRLKAIVLVRFNSKPVNVPTHWICVKTLASWSISGRNIANMSK